MESATAKRDLWGCVASVGRVVRGGFPYQGSLLKMLTASKPRHFGGQKGGYGNVQRTRGRIHTISSLSQARCRGSWAVLCSYTFVGRVSFFPRLLHPSSKRASRRPGAQRLTQVRRAICRFHSLVSPSTLRCRDVLEPTRLSILVAIRMG